VILASPDDQVTTVASTHLVPGRPGRDKPALACGGLRALFSDERRGAAKERQGARREGSAAKWAAWREPASAASPAARSEPA